MVVMPAITAAFICWLGLRYWQGRQPTYGGQPLVELLRTTNNGSMPQTMAELLTMPKIGLEEADGITKFELPVSYAALKKVGYVSLYIDPSQNKFGRSGKSEYRETACASNGNVLIEWDAAHDSPGWHELQLQLYVQGQKLKRDYRRYYGPILRYESTNALRFPDYPYYAVGDPRRPFLYASFIGSNANYTIVLQSLEGRHLKTITGATTNGMIEKTWDALDEEGDRYTNSFLIATISLELPDYSFTNAPQKIQIRNKP